MVTGDGRADAISCQERVAAEQSVAGALEIRIGLQWPQLKAMLGKPLLRVDLFDLALSVAEMGGHRDVAKDQRSVGGEHQVGHARLRPHKLNIGPCLFQQSPQVLPLGNRQAMIGPPQPVHPGVDLILDAVVVRRTHQDAGGTGHGLDEG